jgi:hypothetical protein
MDSLTLKTFRAQLGDWIESRLSTGQYPFRRVESTPEIVTESDVTIPDLVLWVNRESYLAGGLILLPIRLDEETLRYSRDMAGALGLRNFVTWAARETVIWEVREQNCTRIETLALPPAQHVTPEDFITTLDHLLTRLKLLTVTGAISAKELSPYYFVNLCMLTLKNILPGQTEASRLNAESSHPDTWAAKASIDKIWMTLWRLLLLLKRDLLPASYQPDRLERAMTYTLLELDIPGAISLTPEETEPALTEEASIRFHHMGNRLRQLHWAQHPDRATDTIELLLRNAAETFLISSEPFPWPVPPADLEINYSLPGNPGKVLVAPRPYLAGLRLLTDPDDLNQARFQACDIREIPGDNPPQKIIANLHDSSIPPATDYSKRLIGLREVWPNHRFSLPNKTPVWVWEGLYLFGLVPPQSHIHLILPPDWAFTSGAAIFLAYLLKRKHLVSYGQMANGHAALQLGPILEDETFELFRWEDHFQIPQELLKPQAPELLHFCLNCHKEILELFLKGRLRINSGEDFLQRQDLAEAAFLFLHSSIGRHIWQCLTGHPMMPDTDVITEIIESSGILLPQIETLGSFSLIGWQPGMAIPSRERLDRVLLSCWGTLPKVPDLNAGVPAKRKVNRSSSEKLRRGIARKVFRDGLPRFPEHYLMNYYRPELRTYSFAGPLEYHDSFFDRIFLRDTAGGNLELGNKSVAEALLLVSHSKRLTVDLPVDETLVEDLLHKYRADLAKLWKELLRECRRQIPIRQRALSTAKKIWKDHDDLPPLDKSGLPS